MPHCVDLRTNVKIVFRIYSNSKIKNTLNVLSFFMQDIFRCSLSAALHGQKYVQHKNKLVVHQLLVFCLYTRKVSISQMLRENLTSRKYLEYS